MANKPTANATNGRPIIVKRIKKVAGGHHGGSWKVAYADFVTAMMAFFLLLWLLNNLPGDKKDGVAKYFRAPGSTEMEGGGAGEVKGTGVIADRNLDETSIVSTQEASLHDKAKKMEEDKKRLENLKTAIAEAIKGNPTLTAFKDQLIMDMTSEGLRIQLVDKENRPMFDSGGADVKPYMRTMLREITKTLSPLPNKVSIAGHTDAVAFLGRADYSNWELSVDRANAARREMAMSGYPIDKFARVIGLASTVLYLPDQPSDPMNRRTSIVVLTQDAAERIQKEEMGQGTDHRLVRDAATIFSAPSAPPVAPLQTLSPPTDR
ncbi:MAG: flagellar motor protein MotB [Gammaproteobacteria bacterium]|nr:flagellar motor protein MotB [Gammaproteobacteria bacterium]